MKDPRDYIDWDEARESLKPFYAVAEPCESCGEPTFRGRVWNAEHQIWIGTDCSCNTPDLPTCRLLVPLLQSCGSSVREVCKVIKAHRLTCRLCGPVTLPVRPSPSVVKEAA